MKSFAIANTWATNFAVNKLLLFWSYQKFLIFEQAKSANISFACAYISCVIDLDDQLTTDFGGSTRRMEYAIAR